MCAATESWDLASDKYRSLRIREVDVKTKSMWLVKNNVIVLQWLITMIVKSQLHTITMAVQLGTQTKQNQKWDDSRCPDLPLLSPLMVIVVSAREADASSGLVDL